MPTNRMMLPVALILGIFTTFSYADDDMVWYRYTNDQGVQVINHTIPTEYAQKGYEVVNSSGKVLEVVAPAPSKDEVAEANAMRELRNRYEELRRRYGSMDDIKQARKRRLLDIESNIAVVTANLAGLKSKIESLHSAAAIQERKTGKVSKQILLDLSGTEAELKVAEKVLGLRETEYEDMIKRFDKDMAIFAQGETLFQSSDQRVEADN